MEKLKFKISVKDATEILRGKAVFMTDAEKRAARYEIANMLESLSEQNSLLMERNYQLEERIAIMTEGTINDG